MPESTRILVVDDFEEWRRYVRASVGEVPGFQVVGEASSGLEAIQQAQQLRPDLVVLDIGLPNGNGLEAARQIRELSATTVILFLSENRSADIAEEALRSGALGYVIKGDARKDLLPAIEAVLSGKPFVSTSLAERMLAAPEASHKA